MKTYLIGMLSYGPDYTKQFLDFHLRAILCSTNLPAVIEAGEYKPEYIILTDDETLPQIEAHINFKRLKNLVNVQVIKLSWPEGNKYNFRYSAIVALTQILVTQSLERDAIFTQFASDIIPAQGFLPSILSRATEGYDAVLGLPWRTAFEPLAQHLNQYTGAIPPSEFGRLAFDNLHPLWTHSHWSNPQFSKLPFCLLWNTGTGLMVRTFSVSPLLLKPYPEMLTSQYVIDADIPTMFKKPFWASDWLDAPVIEAGFLFSYYPPFDNKPSSILEVTKWASRLSPRVHDFILDRFYFPSKAQTKITEDIDSESSHVATAIWAGLQSQDRRDFLDEHLNQRG